MSIAYAYHKQYHDHDTGAHPECEQRLTAINRALAEYDLKDKLEFVAVEPAPIDAIGAVHTKEHIQQVAAFSRQGGGQLTVDTVFSPGSYDAAVLAAGGTMGCVDHVMNGIGGAFAAVRPPGHHATSDAAMGFCIFNNAAIAAQHALTNWNLERVLIFDFDVHHGNGTESIFYNRSDVVYISVHQYPAYPGTGRITDTGVGDGIGHTINIPLPPGSGDDALIAATVEIVVPVLAAYDPQLVICSAGFDGHAADPLADLRWTCAGWSRMMSELMEAAKGCRDRIVGVLEGGYNLGKVGLGAALFISHLLGEPLTVTDDSFSDAGVDWRQAIDDALMQVRTDWRM